ncbi:MAG: branched-chain amino acid transport system II carrier protein [Parachlamydiaceae bacterium]|nr:branched-chain amino acid transport system II carrier protein [Parachlamydiaceae bacterium]
MEQQTQKSNTIATGLAMFSMFFGAGNVVFPLALGQYAQDQNLYAILGLLISAVGVPFLGLIAMTLFNGNYKHFFERIGVVPGFLVSAAIMGLIGPFGAIPRCITLSFATLKIYSPDLSLPVFSILSCLIILLLTIRPGKILDILGYVLTPILIGSLAIIIVKGIITSPAAPHADHSSFAIFWKGLTEGYQTMDLLGAFFFSYVVLACLERNIDTKNPKNYRRVIWLALKASGIGAFLLALSYMGFSYVAAFNSEALAHVPKDELAGTVANIVLGPYAGVVACIAVSMACLTTAIALSAVFAEFVHKDLTANKLNYEISLVITLIVSFFVSTLHFTGIAAFLQPILQICYPALIVLSIVNIAHKLYHFQPVKVPVFGTFILSAIGYYFL